jgi:hypothetical protein
VAHEVASSEESYVRSLELLVARYVQPIVSAEPEVLNAATRKELSASLSEILAVHRLLLADLQACMATWDDASSRVGPLFAKFAPYFKLYNEYCANYNSFISKISQKLQRADHPLTLLVQRIADELRAEANLRLDLASFLIMPVQRLPRYRLLLVELVDATPPAHADRPALVEAVELVTKIAQQVNASVAARANRDKLMAISAEIRGSAPAIVAPQRTFVREGELRKLCRKGVKRRRVWLFSDSLLYATPSDVPGTRISLKPVLLMLRGASVAEVPPGSLAIDDVTPYALQISTATKSFMAYCESTEERNAWLEALIRVILALGSPGAAAIDAPIWVPDEIATHCMVCEVPFSLFTRRHHCRRCGKVCCAACSTMRALLANIGEEARVCNHCYTTVTGLPVPDPLAAKAAGAAAKAPGGAGDKAPDTPTASSKFNNLSVRGTVAFKKLASKLMTPTAEASVAPPLPPKVKKSLPALPAGAAASASVAAPSAVDGDGDGDEDSDDIPPPVTPGIKQMLSVFPYTAVEENELSFAAGVIVDVVDWDVQSAWWIGKLADGSTGLVPVNHFTDAPGQTAPAAVAAAAAATLPVDDSEPPPFDAEPAATAATSAPASVASEPAAATSESAAAKSEPAPAKSEPAPAKSEPAPAAPDEPAVAVASSVDATAPVVAPAVAPVAEAVVAQPTAAAPVAVAVEEAAPPLPPKKLRTSERK